MMAFDSGIEIYMKGRRRLCSFLVDSSDLETFNLPSIRLTSINNGQLSFIRSSIIADDSF